MKQILKGDTQIVCDLLMDEMQALAMDLRFEEAQAIKEKYDLIESYRSRSEFEHRKKNRLSGVCRKQRKVSR